MPRYKLTIEYDGTGLNGWQKQDNVPTVQGLLEAAVEKYCGQKVEVAGSGRTDAGVHALAQVAHIDLHGDHDEYRVMSAINFHLVPHKVAVLSAEKVPDEFHARFSAKKRYYRYHITNRRPRLALREGHSWHVPEELNIAGMREAATLLIGQYDFSTFRDSMCQARSPVKTLDELNVEKHDEEVIITTSARSFLHHQVRNMVGSLVQVGKGKWSVTDFKAARDAKDRTKGGPTAPAEGLFFVRVEY